MADEILTPVVALGGSGGLLSLLGGYFLKTHNERIKKIEDGNANIATNLSSYQLDSEKRFAKQDDVKAMDAELKASIERLHSRLDQTATARDMQDLTKRINAFLERKTL